MVWSRILITALLAVSPSVAAPAKPAPAKAPVKAPARAPVPVAARPGRAPISLMKTRHLAVQVKVNGAGPFRIIFDTGSPITFFSNAAAAKAGLITPQQAKAPGLMGMRGRVLAKTVQVGDAVMKDVQVMVLDHPTIQQIAQVDGPLDGIVGLSFFGRYKTTLDYSKSEILLEPGTYEPQELTQSISSRLLSRQAPPRKVLAAGGLWGLRVEKPDEEPGVRVAEVHEGGAADAAGLKAGDRLLTLDHRWTDSETDCLEAAALAKPGQPVLVRVQREGQTLELTVRPRAGV